MRASKRPRRTIAEHGPHPVDVHVGSRVHLRRKLLGMSQTDLGRVLGVTFQQVQKNERGVNRISSSRLYQLSLIFGVPVTYFFEGLEDNEDKTSRRSRDDVMLKCETPEMVRAYYRIRDPKVRKALRAMAKAMGKGIESR